MAQQSTIVPTSSSSTFPGCALSCAALLQAQTACTPPSVQTSSQLVYDQCFCSSALLAPFTSTSDEVCLQECTYQGDRQQLQAWYNNFCAQVKDGIDPTTQTATPATSTVATLTASVTTGTSVATAADTSTSTKSSSETSTPSNQSWIEGHWKYVLMLAILAVGLGLLAWLAVWWKRRYNRKLEAQRAAASGFNYDPEKRPANDPKRVATPDLWGPHQMMQATQGYGYTTETVNDDSNKRKSKHRAAESSGKKDPSVIEIREIDRTMSPRPPNKRARPSELEANARMIGAADRRSKSREMSMNGAKDKDVEADLLEMPKSRSRSGHTQKT